jgi:predicted glutamine amidotransferase
LVRTAQDDAARTALLNRYLVASLLDDIDEIDAAENQSAAIRSETARVCHVDGYGFAVQNNDVRMYDRPKAVWISTVSRTVDFHRLSLRQYDCRQQREG